MGTHALTWGRFRDLLARLPADSCHVRALSGEDVGEWTLDRHLLASQIDHMRSTNWLIGALLVALGGARKNPVPEPSPVPRPGIETKKPNEGKGFMALAARMGQRPIIR